MRCGLTRNLRQARSSGLGEHLAQAEIELAEFAGR